MNAMKAAKKGAQGDDENRHDRIHQCMLSSFRQLIALIVA
jgi:hypothetical protein